MGGILYKGKQGVRGPHWWTLGTNQAQMIGRIGQLSPCIVTMLPSNPCCHTLLLGHFPASRTGSRRAGAHQAVQLKVFQSFVSLEPFQQVDSVEKRQKGVRGTSGEWSSPFSSSKMVNVFYVISNKNTRHTRTLDLRNTKNTKNSK